MTELPTGTVTFLFTDLEGSTRLWEQHPDAMRDALARHDEILREAVEKRGGHVVKTTGDGLHAAFATAHDATSAAVDAQRALDRESWPLPDPLQVRMGLHTGEADIRDGDYYGTAVNRAARIAAVAHGGQIVCSRATEELVRDALSPDAQLVDLGDHQLRDLARPEHIFQIRGDGLRDEFPPLRSLDAFPGNLPLRPTSFVGRDADLERVARALDHSRIVTLTGVGGVGKTRLALQVAAEVVPHFADGAWFCELAAADSAPSLEQVVAVTLGVPLRGGADATDNLVEYLKAKRLLLVLDNCEHLIDAAGMLAERIIQTCPEVRIIATSREGLAVDGEQVIPLRSLSVPDVSAGAESVVTNPAVSLFVERAAAAKADYELRDVDVAAVVEICRRLDGIPLAIELAAARVVAMAPGEIAGLLDERFRLLTGGRRTAVERHQTLRATVDWSYSLLDERDRTVFDRLGVFAGSFAADSAAAVIADNAIERFDVLDALIDLVTKSLVMTEVVDDGTTRYSLLETLRQYARERLDEDGVSDVWRRRHAAYYADFAETAAPLFFTAEEIETRKRIELELDNLRAAVTWALDRDDRDDNELGVRIPAALYNEATLRRASGISDWAQRALPFVDSSTPVRRYEILCCVAWDAHAQARLDECIEIAQRVLREPIPDEIEYCISPYLSLSSAYAMQGRLDDATRTSAEALELIESRGAPDWVHANMLAVFAMGCLGNGDVDQGRRLAEAAVQHAERSRNPSALAMAGYALGWALCDEDSETAIESLSGTIELCQAGAIDAVQAPAVCQRAVLLLLGGKPTEAVRDLQWGFERSVEIGDALTIGAATLATVAALAKSSMPESAAVVLGTLDAVVIWSFITSGFTVLDVDELRAEIMRSLPAERFDAEHARGASMQYAEAIDFVRVSIRRLEESFQN